MPEKHSNKFSEISSDYENDYNKEDKDMCMYS